MERRRTDRGDTLIEVLAAVSILGIGIAGLLTALATQASTTITNRDQSQASAALLSAAEWVKAQSFNGCSPAAETAITNAQVARGTGLTVTYGPGTAVAGTACTDLAVVPVHVSGGGFSLSVDVVKRP